MTDEVVIFPHTGIHRLSLLPFPSFLLLSSRPFSPSPLEGEGWGEGGIQRLCFLHSYLRQRTYAGAPLPAHPANNGIVIPKNEPDGQCPLQPHPPAPRNRQDHQQKKNNKKRNTKGLTYAFVKRRIRDSFTVLYHSSSFQLPTKQKELTREEGLTYPPAESRIVRYSQIAYLTYSL